MESSFSSSISLTNSAPQDENQNPEAASPNAMMVDAPEEPLVEPNGPEAEDASTDNPETVETDTPLLANDCTFPSHKTRSRRRLPSARADPL